jgi:hypothetical protein
MIDDRLNSLARGAIDRPFVDRRRLLKRREPFGVTGNDMVCPPG